jgi:transcriptional regulator with XRE-family HTH domain
MTDKNIVHTPKRPNEKDHLRALGFRIVEHRNARGWKQRELARRAGIEPGRLSRIERGIASPNLDEMFRLKAVFGGSLDELFLGEVPAGPEGSLDELARDLERLGSRDEIAILRRLFHLLVLGYRQEQRQTPARGDRA